MTIEMQTAICLDSALKKATMGRNLVHQAIGGDPRLAFNKLVVAADEHLRLTCECISEAFKEMKLVVPTGLVAPTMITFPEETPHAKMRVNFQLLFNIIDKIDLPEPLKQQLRRMVNSGILAINIYENEKTSKTSYGDIVMGWMKACNVQEKETARFLKLSMVDFQKLLNGQLEVNDELAQLITSMKQNIPE